MGWGAGDTGAGEEGVGGRECGREGGRESGPYGRKVRRTRDLGPGLIPLVAAQSAPPSSFPSLLSKCHAYQTPIRVYAAEQPVYMIGAEDYDQAKPLLLSYHRHFYALGEHYNSVVPVEGRVEEG